MELVWQTHAWEDYLYWQETDKKVLLKINELIKDCLRNPFKGMGKPEPLKAQYKGFWSRRITDEHRLIYTVKDKQLYILLCRFHYDS
jgi:toxin YoeB